jgi:tight adherence protein B
MGALVGLLLGVGILLVWTGFTLPAFSSSSATKTSRLREQLNEAGLRGVRPIQLVAVQLVMAFLTFVVLFVITSSFAVTAVFASFASAVPRLLVASLRNKRQAELREVWPEIVDNLTSGVRAGLSLPEAVSAIGLRGPEAIREPFARFGADYRISGRFNESLDRLKASLANPTGDRVCESLRVARDVGGTDLGKLLSTLSAFLRDDARTRSELLARQSWSVNAARLAVCAPWLMLLFLATRQETLAAYDSAAGLMILLIGSALSVVAYRLMVRIGRLSEERRVLR